MITNLDDFRCINTITRDPRGLDEESADIRQNILYRLRATNLKRFPYVHFHGDQAFDARTSSNIRTFWPSGNLFVSLANTNRVSGGTYEQRNILPVTQLIERLPCDSPAQKFWAAFNSAVGGDEFLCEMLEWLWPEIKKVRTLPEEVSLYSELVLTDDSAGYSIGPHTDSPSRLITLLLYVPDGAESSHAGTSIYIPKQANQYKEVSAVHRNPKDFIEVFSIPFLPDAFFGFIVSPKSFHGVAPVKNLRARRRQIQYTIRLHNQSRINS